MTGPAEWVLLEIARAISKDSLDICVEFIFFDVEDYGAPQQTNGFLIYKA